jgi:aryl-alcohol dehydrogenase-like predicted oxidoreductase
VKYRPAGNTGLRLSEIGFGCGGNAGLMVRASQPEQLHVVGRALELGINYFDNAPDYGDGAAEENLGRVLRELRARPIINSKVEVREADLGDIAGHVVRSAERSLERLGVECLDLLQIHNGPASARPAQRASAYTQLALDDFLRPGGAIEGLQRLVRDGKARHLGFICRGNDAAEVRQLIDTGVFGMINVPYTLLNPTAGRARPDGLEVDRDYGSVLDYASVHGVGTAIYSALAGGVLIDGDRHPLSRPVESVSAAYERNRRKARAFAFLKRDTGDSLAQAAVRFVLSHPAVSVVLGGFSAIEHVEEIVGAANAGPLDRESLARIEAVWRTNFGFGKE